jgi:ATP-dependent Clp protease ATP-binding subunit ClpC
MKTMKNNSVSSSLKLIVNNAKEEAELFGDSKVRPEHLLLSIIHANDPRCASIFEALKVDTSYLYDRISDALMKADLNTRVGNRKDTMLFSSETKLVFKGIDKECEYLKDKSIESTHLFLSILSIKSPLSIMLFEMGISYMMVKNCIKSIRSDVTNGVTNEDFDDNQFSKPAKRTSNKTVVLDNFCRDISAAVKNGEVDKVVGRKAEIKRVAQILSRRRKNSPVLIGVAGSGKTAIVEGLAQLINNGETPRTLIGKRILSLDLAAMVAGTKYRGQFEERMKAVMEECKGNKDVILFIDELHTMVGAGNSSGSMDASNILKPALSRGEIQIIGATTLDEYRENIEKDGALTRRFQQVLIQEPSLKETITILSQIKDKYEKHHNVFYTDEAIEECVKLADRYIMDRAMPDKAIDVLDEAGAATNMNIEKSEKLKNLEIEKEKIAQKKVEVVAKQRYEDAAKLRDEEKKIEAILIEATKEWNTLLSKEVKIVDATLVSEVVSNMTGIPLSKISVQETKKLVNLDKELQEKLIGQDEAVTKVVKAIKRSRVGIKDKNKPVASYIFLGPTGVGKSMLAKLIAEYVYGDADSLVRMDMSEYMEKFSVSRLIGPPPGYVGYEQGGQLTEKIRRKPYSVILFDEIEKAHEDVFNLLLQLLDEGQLTDGLGRKVNFKNSLIILTSNVGVSELNSFGKTMGFETPYESANQEERNKSIIDKALKKKFKPEFLNRIDEAIVFNSLSEENIHKIIYCEVAKLEKRLSEIGYKIKLSETALNYIAKNGYDKKYGARPLNRAIQRYVEDPIADEILNGKIKEGETIKINYDEKNDIISVTSSKK